MKIGITSTIPVEIVYAAGHQPCDLNNLFICDADPGHFIARAEEAGFPRTTCAWIKGIYGVLQAEKIDTVIVVSGGDCSNTLALGEVLCNDGLRVIPFSYPLRPDPVAMRRALDRLARELNAEPEATAAAKTRLDAVRRRLAELDRLTWEEGVVSGRENLNFLVSASDFKGDPESFAEEIASLLAAARKRSVRPARLRLGLAGVPPILGNLCETLEELGAELVFNEVPRQFAMPWAPECGLAEQYTRYTYPYQVERRLADIAEACRVRKLDGIIHYTQSFCFRQIEDILFKRLLPVPVLTLEADRPETVDGRTLTRLETFIEMLSGAK
jgi:benzoyl-CoA reductase/2-hydroxyglutaryl-CoA dehydratase subunit BcrC/BadD/HgdB